MELHKARQNATNAGNQSMWRQKSTVLGSISNGGGVVAGKVAAGAAYADGAGVR